MEVQNNGIQLEVFFDLDSDSPREWDNVGTMVCFHNRYALGDRHNYDSPQDFKESDEAKSAYVCLPIFLYDHTIQKLSNQSFIGRAQHAEWDSGQVGFIYVTNEKVKELTGLEPTEENKTAVSEMLCAETELYSSYIEGDCYGFSIKDMQGNELDSCGGFYGDDMSEVLRQMKEQSDNVYEPLFAKMQAQVKTLYTAMT